MLIPITLMLTVILIVKLSLRAPGGWGRVCVKVEPPPREVGGGTGAGRASWGRVPPLQAPTGAWAQLGLRLPAPVTLSRGDSTFMVPVSV